MISRTKPSIVEVEDNPNNWEVDIIDAKFILANLRAMKIAHGSRKIKLSALQHKFADRNSYNGQLGTDIVDEEGVYTFSGIKRAFKYVLLENGATKGDREVGITVGLYDFPGCLKGEAIYRFHGEQMINKDPNNSYILEYKDHCLDMRGIGRYMDDLPELARGKHLFGLSIRDKIPYLVANYNIAPLPNLVLKVVWSYGLDYWLEPEQFHHLSKKTMVSMRKNNKEEWDSWLTTHWNEAGRDKYQAKLKGYNPETYTKWFAGVFRQRKRPKLGPGHVIGVTPPADPKVRIKNTQGIKIRRRGTSKSHCWKYGRLVRKHNYY